MGEEFKNYVEKYLNLTKNLLNFAFSRKIRKIAIKSIYTCINACSNDEERRKVFELIITELLGLLEYDIESTKTASTPLGFPSTYGAFSNSDLQIIEPLYNPLTRGQLIDVKFRTTTFDNLYILNDNHLRELDSNGNGEFTASGVYIFAEEVYLVTEQSGGYAYLAQYTTAPDPNSSTEPTFPDAFGAPKNVLYSPLTDTLIIGKTYEFKIECESATKIAVLEGSNFSYLTKNGSMFTGSVKINGKASTISIVSISNGYYYTYYRYRTSR